MNKTKEITNTDLFRLAEHALKDSSCTNTSKLFNQFYKSGMKVQQVKQMAADIEKAFYSSALSVINYNPETEQETRTQCIDKIVDAISKNIGIDVFEERPDIINRASRTDYRFTSKIAGLTNSVTIEAKKLSNNIFTSKNAVYSNKANQAVGYGNTNANEEAYSITIETNGRHMAVFMKGNLNYTSTAGIMWQPLRNEKLPILTLSCYSISYEACVVLAYIIVQSLNGNHRRVLSIVKDVFETELGRLKNECKDNNIKVV